MEISRILRKYEIILASASPRRKELLEQAGLKFTVLASQKDEVTIQTEPKQLVMELSEQKASEVRAQLGTDFQDRQLIIAADTVVFCENEILGKPRSREDAVRMIKLLQGKRHQVYTGVTLLTKKKRITFQERTDVIVYPMSQQEIEEYIDCGESMDKAGAYGIQGRFAAYVKGIEGDYQNVVGLPVARILKMIGEMSAKKDIRLVATDIDGTLVKESAPEVYPEMIEMFRQLRNAGVLCCVASGRTYHSIKQMFAEVADELLFIAENGAHIVYKGKNLSVIKMNPEDAAAIVQEMRSLGDGYEYVISTPEGSLLESGDKDFIRLIRDGYHNKMEIVPDILNGSHEIIKAAVHYPGSIRELGEKRLIPEWKHRVKVCMAGEEWVDFMDASVDKGNAIRFVQNYFDIGYDETVTFGDNENDIGLMQAASESYAVENARDAVKKAAAHICGDYNHKGVYQVLRKLLEELS